MEAVWRFFIDFLIIVVKVFAFVHNALTGEASTADVMVAFIVVVCLFGFVYALLIEITQLSLIHVPFLSANPPLYPASSKYLIKLGDLGKPGPFQWQYPYLLADGGKYNIRRSSYYKGDTPRLLLSSGTVIEFIPR